MRRRRVLLVAGWGLLGVAAGLAAVRGQGPGEGRGRFGGPQMFPLMQALDADGDGELSAKEIENASAALKTLDKDKNGRLTREEMFPAFGGMGRGGMGMGPGANVEETVRTLMAFDKDGDGKLSRAELPERLRALMDRADANKDGFLDRNELSEFARRRAGRGPGFAPGGRGEGPRRKGEGPGRDRGDGERRDEGRRETDV